MAKQEWFDEVVAVVRAKGTEPVFPGDADPVYAVLDRLNQKLTGECHNGGELGGDGCVPCRAYRADAAERDREATRKEAEQAHGECEALSLALNAAVGDFQTASEQRRDLAENFRRAQEEVGAQNRQAQHFQRVSEELASKLASMGEAYDHLSTVAEEREAVIEAQAERLAKFEDLAQAMKAV